MENQIFCDGIGRISVIGGLVRLDLFTYSPSETDANGQPRPILSHRIVMGMEGFARSGEKVLDAMQQINRAQAGQPGAAPTAPQPAQPQAAPRPAPPPQQQPQAQPQPQAVPAPPPPQPQPQSQPQPGAVQAAPIKPPFP
jgi:hypothetical protein